MLSSKKQFNVPQQRAEYSSETESDAKIKKAMQELRKIGAGQLMPEWKLKRKLGLSQNDFDAVVSELIRRRLAAFEKMTTKERPQSGFRILR